MERGVEGRDRGSSRVSRLESMVSMMESKGGGDGMRGGSWAFSLRACIPVVEFLGGRLLFDCCQCPYPPSFVAQKKRWDAPQMVVRLLIRPVPVLSGLLLFRLPPICLLDPSLSLARSLACARADQSRFGAGVKSSVTRRPVALPSPIRVAYCAQLCCVVEGLELSVRRVRGPPDRCSEASLHGRRHEHGHGTHGWARLLGSSGLD